MPAGDNPERFAVSFPSNRKTIGVPPASEVAIWRQAEWGDMRVGYETYLSDFDDTELLKDSLMIGVNAPIGNTF